MAATRIGKGITYVAILNVFQFVVGIVFYYVVSNILTPTEIGVMSTLNFAHATFIVLAPLGLQFAAVKYVADYLARGDQAGAAAVAKTVTRLVLVASFGFLAVFIGVAVSLIRVWANMEGIELLFIVISVAAAFGALRNAYLALLQGLQFFDRYAIANLAAMSLSRLFGMILVLMRQGLLGVVSGILLGEACGLLLTFYFYRGHLPVAKQGVESKVLFSFSLPIFGMMMLATLQDWSDRMLFLIVSHDLDVLGLFELVIRASTSLGIVGAIVDVIMLPVFSDAFAKGGKERMASMLTTALRYLGFLYFPAAMGMATISRTTMTILYQTRTAEAGYLPLTVLAIFSVFNTFATILNSGLKSIGRTSSFVRISLLALIVDSVIVAILSPRVGLYGAVVARSASVFVTFVYTLLLLRKEVVVRVEWDGLWKALVASASIILPVVLLDRFVRFPHIFINLAAEMAVAVAVYALMLLFLKALKRQDFRILRQMIPPKLLGVVDVLERLYVR